MKKILLVLLAACVLVGCQNKKDDGVIRVGAAIALTGYGADFGESERNAIQMLKECSSSTDVEFYIEDTSSDVKTGLNAIKKLIDIYDVDIIYCDLSAIVHAANQLINDNQKILVAPVYLESLLENPRAYRNLPSADQENKCLIKYMMDYGINHERTIILCSNDVFGQTCRDSFCKLMGNKVVETIIIQEESLRDVCTKAVKLGADVIYIGSMSDNVGLIVRNLRQLGFQGEILTTDAYSYDYINEKAGILGKNVIYVDFLETQSYQQFKYNYEKLFKKKCIPSAMLCYDGISAIVSAMKSGSNLEEKFFYHGVIDTVVIYQQEIIYPIEIRRW